jgi:hypothetical protein
MVFRQQKGGDLTHGARERAIIALQMPNVSPALAVAVGIGAIPPSEIDRGRGLNVLIAPGTGRGPGKISQELI